MKKRFGSIAIALAILLATEFLTSPHHAFAEEEYIPVLGETRLYREIAHQCNNVDLETWLHPTKEVLKQLRISITNLQLCNDNKYPIFFVNMPLDPIYHSQDDQTKSYFGKLWKGMMKANGYWPFALVDLDGERVIYVKPEYFAEEREYYTTTDYDQFRVNKTE